MGYLPQDEVNVVRQNASFGATTDSAEAVQFSIVYQEIEQLIAMIANENVLLKAHDVDGIQDLHNEKLRLVRRIELRKELISRHPEHVMSWTLDQKHQLASLQHVLEDHLAENLMRTQIAQRINRKVVDSVVEALEQKRNISSGYNQTGQVAKDSLGSDRMHTSHALAINESV